LISDWEEQVRANCERGWPADYIDRGYLPPDWNKVYPVIGGPPQSSRDNMDAYNDLLNTFTQMLEPRDLMALKLTKEATDAIWESKQEEEGDTDVISLAQLTKGRDFHRLFEAGVKYGRNTELARFRLIRQRDNALRQLERWRKGPGAKSRRLEDRFLDDHVLAQRYAEQFLAGPDDLALAPDGVGTDDIATDNVAPDDLARDDLAPDDVATTAAAPEALAPIAPAETQDATQPALPPLSCASSKDIAQAKAPLTPARAGPDYVRCDETEQPALEGAHAGEKMKEAQTMAVLDPSLDPAGKAAQALQLLHSSDATPRLGPIPSRKDELGEAALQLAPADGGVQPLPAAHASEVAEGAAVPTRGDQSGKPKPRMAFSDQAVHPGAQPALIKELAGPAPAFARERATPNRSTAPGTGQPGRPP
jgi:hypothetical protein